MPEIKNRQALIEVEYCLDKYFEENFSPIVAKTSKEMKEKQQIEAQKIRSGASGSPWGVTGSAGLPVQSMVIEQQVHQGEWNSKRTEDLIEMCNEKFFKNDNIQHGAADDRSHRPRRFLGGADPRRHPVLRASRGRAAPHQPP